MQKIEIAKVLKPQGIKGEIKVECFTSDIEFLSFPRPMIHYTILSLKAGLWQP